MKCEACGRALIASDARLDVDARDDHARLEIVCECGAIHSALVRPEDWVFGLDREGADRLPGQLEYCETAIGRFRWLVVTDFTHGRPRTFIKRLGPLDPRPLGREMEAMADSDAWLDSLPFGRWRELVREETRP